MFLFFYIILYRPLDITKPYVLRKLAYTLHVRIRDKHGLIFGGKFMYACETLYVRRRVFEKGAENNRSTYTGV